MKALSCLFSKPVVQFLALTILALASLSHPARAQNYSWNDFLESITTDEDYADSEEWLQYIEELQLLHEHPININTATRDDLRRLPMLDDKQIEQIQAYIYLHGQMQTLGELRLLPLIDEDTRRALPLFVYAQEERPPSSSRLLSNLHSTFSSRLDIPLYYRQGYLDDTYVGNPLYHRIRYQIGNGHHFQAGLRVEKDAGERFYDSYGAYAQVRNIGILSTALVGDYRAGFGEGLVLGASTSFSKSNLLGYSGRGIRPMTSMSETDFLRGAAFSLRLGKKFQLSSLFSYRQLDATLNDNGEVQTFLRTGYHRTQRERATHHNVSSTLVGAHLEWKKTSNSSGRDEMQNEESLQDAVPITRNNSEFNALGSKAEGKVGLTFLYSHFSRLLNPGDMLYRRYFPRGKEFAATGVNYGYQVYRWTFAGETAYSWEQGGLATLNRVKWMAGRRWTMSVVQRYYDKKYYSFGASSLAESTGGFNAGGAAGTAGAGNVQNESGVLLSMQGQFAESWSLASYFDYFHHPWPRYGMTHSSSGQEGMVQLGYQFSRRQMFTARYQFKRKEVGDVMEPHHRLKLQWQYSPDRNGGNTAHGSWTWKTVGMLHQVLGSTGVALGETVQCIAPLSASGRIEHLRLTALTSWFYTEDYASRIYLYTPSLYNSLFSPSLSGHGCHNVLCVRWKDLIRQKMEWWMEARLGSTCFFDRKEQSSGEQRILGRWKNDVQVQFVLKY
ncbi:MAG: helix-hairpin-helix domain-containing protein [Bacteroidaceae bacterium]|nr:helix-hairpin-helix domain-containing protein [Bacteroidaceae bacterium]